MEKEKLTAFIESKPYINNSIILRYTIGINLLYILVIVCFFIVNFTLHSVILALIYLIYIVCALFLRYRSLNKQIREYAYYILSAGFLIVLADFVVYLILSDVFGDTLFILMVVFQLGGLWLFYKYIYRNIKNRNLSVKASKPIGISTINIIIYITVITFAKNNDGIYLDAIISSVIMILIFSLIYVISKLLVKIKLFRIIENEMRSIS